MALIEVKDVVKEYRVNKHRKGLSGAFRDLFDRKHTIIKALDRVSFQIERGELLGYVGPNGAGKSTTIKILTGILVPGSGTVQVNGIVPWEKRMENARRMGVVFGQRSQLIWDIPPIESFDLNRYLYKVPEATYRRNVDMFVELLDMSSFLNQPVRQLSLGQKMRCELAASFLHSPEIVYLDEPTIGLDVVAKEKIRRFLRQVNKEMGVTIILTTHDLTDVEQVCRRLLMIDQGKIVWDGPLEQIKSQFGGKCTLEVDFEFEPEGLNVPEGVTMERQEGPKKWLGFERSQVSAVNVIQEIISGYRVRDISLRETSVEEIVRNIYEKKNLTV